MPLLCYLCLNTMKKIIFIYSIAILVAYCPLAAQNYFNEVYRTDTNVATIIRSIVPTDTAWYVTGVTTVNEPTRHNAGWFARINPNTAQIEAMKIYTDTLKKMEMWSDCLIATNQGELANTCISFKDHGFFLATFDSNGDTMMYKTYPSTPDNSFAVPSDIEQDFDNNYYVLTSVGEYINPPDSTKITLVKIAPNGEELKRWVFPSPDPYCTYKVPSDLYLLPNGHFLISAFVFGPCSVYYPPSDSCRARTWIFEADSLGNILHQYLSSAPDRYVMAAKLTLSRDGGIVFSGKETFIGQSNSYVVFRDRQYIGKLDSNYELAWEYTSKEPHLGYLSRSVEMADGSIWVCGKDKDRRGDTIEYRGILLKFSSDGDSIGRQKFYRLSYPYHSSLTDLWYDQASHFFQDMVMLPDSSLVLVGEIAVDYLSSPTAGYWGWVVHTDKYGCVESEGCFPVGLAQSPIPPWEAVRVAWCKVYPNPAHDYLTFDYQIPSQAVGQAVMIVSDPMGKEVKRMTLAELKGQLLWDTRSLPEGLYYYSLLFGKEQLASGSLSVVHQ